MSHHAFLDTLLQEVSTRFAVPGLQAGFVSNGEIQEVAAHGWRDLESQLPVTTQTPSRWYSISKPLTALALARLVGQGKLAWDQPVSELVPGLRFHDPVATERATIRDCLLHRTGLPAGDWTWFGAPPDPQELIQRIPHIPCHIGFRRERCYQNLHFTILGEVIRSTGSDWHESMHELLEPLGIHPLTTLSEFIASPRMLGYGPGSLKPPQRSADIDFEGTAPASSVCGTIEELARLAQAMARDGEGLLDADRWTEVNHPALASASTEWPEILQPCASLGGNIVVYRGETVLHWAGGFRGYTSHIVALPRRQAAAVSLTNRSASPASDALAWTLLDCALGIEPAPWTGRFLKQKQRFRQAGAERLARRLAAPAAPWPFADFAASFHHPGFGELAIDGQRNLRFRGETLPLVARQGGCLGADGLSTDGTELCWDLQPEIRDKRLDALLFDPLEAGYRYRFARQD